MSIEVLTVASFALSGVQTLVQGAQQRQAAQMEALAARQRAEEARLASEQALLNAQIEANRRQEENQALLAANIAASRFGDPYASPSWLAIKAANDADTARDIGFILASGRDQSRSGQLAARSEVLNAGAALKKGRAQQVTALFGAGKSFLDAGIAFKKLDAGGTT